MRARGSFARCLFSSVASSDMNAAQSINPSGGAVIAYRLRRPAAAMAKGQGSQRPPGGRQHTTGQDKNTCYVKSPRLLFFTFLFVRKIFLVIFAFVPVPSGGSSW